MRPRIVDNNSEYFHFALLQANIGIWDCDVQTGNIQFDSYWAEQFGHTDANTLPTLSYWESLIHPDDQPKTREKLMANLAGMTELFESEHRLQNSEGIYRWFHARGRVVSRDASGVPLRHVGAFWDITEHKETQKSLQDDLWKSEERYRLLAERALSESEEKYRGLAERIPAILMLTDLKGMPHYVSPSVTGILGYAVDDMIGRQPHDFLSPEDTARILGMMSMLEKGMDMESVEVTVPRKDGTPAVIEWVALPVYSDKRITGFQFLGRDHTDRRAAEEELKKSKEKLRNLSAHLQTSIELERKRIAREIHDALGQTLTAIKLDAAWLKKQIPESRKELIDKTAAVIALVNDSIMTVKRICTELRPGLLDDLGLFAAIEWMANDFQKRTGIRICMAEPHQDIDMNDNLATSIFRIFQEALTNAARHSQATQVTISLKQRPNMVELVVNDNGIGITQEQMDDRESYGLMGMTERVHGFGGGIKIFGEKGKGTTITVRIPDDAGHPEFLD